MKLIIRFELDNSDDGDDDLFDEGDDFMGSEDGTAKCGWNGLNARCTLSVERGYRHG